MSVTILTAERIVTRPRNSRWDDYLQLTRPRLTLMVLVTVLLGMFLAGGGSQSAWDIALMLLGTGLVSAGASIFNQFVERRSDARMQRTENRPLPAGRLGITEVVSFGLLSTVGGLICLMFLPSGPAAAIVAGTTFVLYVFAYTPAKRRTWMNTFIGAVPGAMPPLIGWAAARGTLTWDALPLFLILYFWQIPHFMAIAWIYREDYRRAGLQMLPVLDPTGIRTAHTMVGHTLVLVLCSLAPVAFGAGILYALGAALLGAIFFWLAWRFLGRRTILAARRVLKWSLVYLPGLLLVLLIDGWLGTVGVG